MKQEIRLTDVELKKAIEDYANSILFRIQPDIQGEENYKMWNKLGLKVFVESKPVTFEELN